MDCTSSAPRHAFAGDQRHGDLGACVGQQRVGKSHGLGVGVQCNARPPSADGCTHHALATNGEAVPVLLQQAAGLAGGFAQHCALSGVIQQEDGRVVVSKSVRDAVHHLGHKLFRIADGVDRRGHFQAGTPLLGTRIHAFFQGRTVCFNGGVARGHLILGRANSPLHLLEARHDRHGRQQHRDDGSRSQSETGTAPAHGTPPVWAKMPEMPKVRR